MAVEDFEPYTIIYTSKESINLIMHVFMYYAQHTHMNEFHLHISKMALWYYIVIDMTIQRWKVILRALLNPLVGR